MVAFWVSKTNWYRARVQRPRGFVPVRTNPVKLIFDFDKCTGLNSSSAGAPVDGGTCLKVTVGQQYARHGKTKRQELKNGFAFVGVLNAGRTEGRQRREAESTEQQIFAESCRWVVWQHEGNADGLFEWKSSPRLTPIGRILLELELLPRWLINCLLHVYRCRDSGVLCSQFTPFSPTKQEFGCAQQFSTECAGLSIDWLVWSK